MVEAVRKYAEEHGGGVVVVWRRSRAAAELDNDDKLEMLQSLGMEEPALRSSPAGPTTCSDSRATSPPRKSPRLDDPEGDTAPKAIG